ncbi:hypothetical protein [Bacillus solimangrovi]|uniref:Uncharacterized protein n=1 Tax=Bacillus solimangrovi TaxID=1305675 RepID=A0A1E5LDT7_9BACI|nr:hypothetical protein [Bacillus solimangrovi]OEH92189.1 hypothetical protein BFG57_02650 [Bacillus solimangrovi]
MQVQIGQQQTTAKQNAMTEQSLELKKGEQYHAQIKERISDKEAVVTIRGKEVRATFEGKIPAEERIMLQVTGKGDNSIQVKEVPSRNTTSAVSQSAEATKLLQSAGASSSAPHELKQAVQILLDKGIPMTKESVQELKTFFEQSNGTAEQKLKTVQALASKRLEVTQNHLRPIHEVLNGKPLNQILTELAKSIDPEFDISKSPKEISNQLDKLVTQVRQQVEKTPILTKAVQQVRDELLSQGKLPKEQVEKIEKAMQQAKQLQQAGKYSEAKQQIVNVLKDVENELKQLQGNRTQQPSSQNQIEQVRTEARTQRTSLSNESRPSELIRQTREQVQSEPNLQKAVDRVRDQVVNNREINREVSQKVEKALKEAEQLQRMGREQAGRERITQALKQAEVEQVKMEARSQQTSQSIELRPSETIRQTREQMQSEPNFQKAVERVRNQVVNNREINREVAQKVEKALKEAEQLQRLGREQAGRERITQALKQAEVEQVKVESRTQQTSQPTQPIESRPSETIRQTREQMQSEPKFEKAVESVRNQVVNNREINREVAQKVEKALKEAEQLQRMGREQAGRERIMQALKQAEVEQVKVDARLQQSSQPIESRPSEAIHQTREQVQREPNFQKAVERVRNQVVNNLEINRDVSQKVEKALKEAEQLQRMGREQSGRDRITQALKQAEVEQVKVESRTQQTSQPTQPVESRLSETIRQTRELVQSEPKFEKIMDRVRSEVVNNREINREVVQKVEKALREAEQLQRLGREQAGRERITQALKQAEVEQVKVESRTQQSPHSTESRPSETIRQTRELVQSEPKFEKIMDRVRSEVVNNREINREVSQKVEKALKEAEQLQRMGREQSGRDRITQALKQVEVEQVKVEARSQSSQPIESRPSETIRQTREQVQSEPNFQKAVERVRNQVVNNREINREVAQKVEKALKEAEQLQRMGREQAGRDQITQALKQAEVEQVKVESRTQQSSQPIESRPSETIRQTREQVQSEPKFEKAVERVRTQVVINREINREVVQKVEKALREAEQLQRMGREQAGRDRITQALKQAEAEQVKVESRMQQSSQPTESRPSETIRQTREQVQSEPKLEKAVESVRNQVVNNREINREVTQKVEKALIEAEQLQKSGRETTARLRLSNTLIQIEQEVAKSENINKTNSLVEQSIAMETNSTKPTDKLPSELLKELSKQFQKEPSVQQGLSQLKEGIESVKFEPQIIEKLQQALTKSTEFQQKGRELAARQEMMNTINEVEKSLSSQEQKVAMANAQQTTEAQQYVLDEAFQTSINFKAKEMIVDRVTKKLAEATNQFRELKRDISKKLDNIQRLIQQYKKSAYPQVKQILETTISKLDNAILKSDMMLLTDMKTEKQLMQASGQLAEAKKLLQKGNHVEAHRIVQDVKGLIDKIKFQPSDTKVQRFITQESERLEVRTPQQQLLQQLEDTSRGLVRQEPSARQIFETVRSMGLNHDSDLARSLVFNQNDSGASDQQQNQKNMKAVLMQLMRGDGSEQGKPTSHIEQALNNLTGQQLLSKPDSGSNLQTMLFQLPILLDQHISDLQVYVNSRNEGEQVDWENCNLYFLIDTPRLGEVGIMLNANERNLSITIKNNQPGFAAKVSPIAELTKEKLKEVGYNVSDIKFAQLSTELKKTTGDESLESNENSFIPIFTEEGMDFKI